MTESRDDRRRAGRRRAILLFLPLLAAMPLAAQNGTRTLAELRALADRNFESLRIQSLEVRQAELATKIAAGQRLPRIDAAGGYTWVSRTAAIDFSIPGFFSRSFRFGDGNIYDAAVSASAPLFTGFKLANTEEMLREQEAAASAAWSGSRIELANRVAMQYRTLLVARKSLAIIDEQETYLREIAQTRAAFVAQGQALAIDTLHLSARRIQLAVDRASAEQQRVAALRQLMLSSGVDAPFDIADEPPSSSPLETMSVDRLAERAEAQRSELRSLEHAKNASDFAMKTAEGAYYPSVYATGALHYGRPGVDQFKNAWMDYLTAGVRLEWNLFNWGSDRRAAEKQGIEREKAELRESQFRRQVRAQIATLAENLRVRRTMLALIDEQILIEREKLEQTRARLNEGMAVASDLVEAETSLTAARLRREQIALEYQLALTDLATAVGEVL